MVRCRRCRNGESGRRDLNIPAVEHTAVVYNIYHVTAEMLPRWRWTAIGQDGFVLSVQAQWRAGIVTRCEDCDILLGGFDCIQLGRPGQLWFSFYLMRDHVDMDHFFAQSSREEPHSSALVNQVESRQGGTFIFHRMHYFRYMRQLSFYQQDINDSTLQPVDSSTLTESSHNQQQLSSVTLHLESDDEIVISSSTSGRVITNVYLHGNLSDDVENSLNEDEEPGSVAEGVADEAVDRSADVVPVGVPDYNSSESDSDSDDDSDSDSDVDISIEVFEVESSDSLNGMTISEEDLNSEDDIVPQDSAVPSTSWQPREHVQDQRKGQKESEELFSVRMDNTEQRENGVQGASEDHEDGKEKLTCAICLDIYYNPFTCLPCGHIFCEPCLRELANNQTSKTPCPLCRRKITDTCFDADLNRTAKTSFPQIHKNRKLMFRRAPCARWPLPHSYSKATCESHSTGLQTVIDWPTAQRMLMLEVRQNNDRQNSLFNICLFVCWAQYFLWIIGFLLLMVYYLHS